MLRVVREVFASIEEVARAYEVPISVAPDDPLPLILAIERESWMKGIEATQIEREAAAPAATEALRAALTAWLDWYEHMNDYDTPDPVLVAETREALASPEPTPDSGLDVERLRQAMILAGWPADGSAATSSIIAAAYARLSEENA